MARKKKEFIQKFDGQTVETMREEMKEALKSVCDRYGVGFDLSGRITYSPTSFKMAVECAITGGEDLEKVQFEQDAIKYGRLYNFTKDDYKRVFTHGGKPYELIGFNANSPKYPFSGVNGAGTRYKFTSAILQTLQR